MRLSYWVRFKNIINTEVQKCQIHMYMSLLYWILQISIRTMFLKLWSVDHLH